MDSYKAWTILAFCASVNALPQVSGLGGIRPAGLAPLSVSAPSGLPVSIPTIGAPALPALGSFPAAPALPSLAAASALPSLPVGASALPVPTGIAPSVPSLPVPWTPEVPDLTELASSPAALSKVVELGTTVLSVILDILSKGASLTKVPTLPKADLPVPVKAPLQKRQATSSARPATATPLPAVGGLTSGLPIGAVTGATPGLPAIGSSPLGAVSGVAPGLPAVGSVSSPVGAVTGAVGAVPVVGSVPVSGSAAAPVLNTVGGATAGVSGATGALSGVTGTVGGVTNGLPVAGSVVSSIPVSVPNLNPAPLTGIPGSDPVGAFSISVIATLLSLLKKDPLSLFGPGLPIAALVKRDLPELHRAGVPELAKRQLNLLPSLSTNVPGVGIGALPLSGIPGVPPDLAFLVGSIAKNIAIPGGNGLGSITGNILSVLNGVVPNFLFQLPVVQDSVPTFGVLQLLSSINPAKFGSLNSLTSLASLSQAAAGISASDMSFVRSLPSSPDPNNLITTIITLSDNMLTLPGNVANLKAAASVLCLKNLGLSVPGL